MKKNSFRESWQDLEDHNRSLEAITLAALFKENSQRFHDFSLEFDDLLFDYSKQFVTQETLKKLCLLAEARNLTEKRAALFSGGIVNHSENRKATHISLRDFKGMKSDIENSLARMEKFRETIQQGGYQDVVCLGIGGSYLGPSLANEALQAYQTNHLRFHFISNIDGKTISALLKKLDPKKTVCIISSKTFTTPETMENAKQIKAWLTKTLQTKAVEQLVGVTAFPERAKAFGIWEKNIFEFSENVGGRYSIWSSVGLPIVLQCGSAHFKDFLMGAFEMDQHFYAEPFNKNMPVLMALLGIWNINFRQHKTLAIMPYEDRLRQLPAYLQQLEMESKGKSVTQQTGEAIPTDVAEVIWGGVGCDGQHAYMQLLHQGKQTIPVDFLVGATPEHGFESHHRLLVASCLSQSKALMEGYHESNAEDPNWRHKICPGNRPSSTLLYAQLTPKILGKIIALYEHKVFTQAMIWDINPFDQWGVELGKKLVKDILENGFNHSNSNDGSVTNNNSKILSDSSTAGLIEFFKRYQT